MEESSTAELHELAKYLESAGVPLESTFNECIADLTSVTQNARDDAQPAAEVEFLLWDGIAEYRMHKNFIVHKSYQATQVPLDVHMPDYLRNVAFSARANNNRNDRTIASLQLTNAALRQVEEEKKRALQAEAAALEEAAEARKLAAREGDAELSGEFGVLASKEGRRAALWTAAAILMTGVGFFAGWILHTSRVLDDERAALLYPVLVAIGAAGLATYFARLGGHHRHTAQWAKSISVQLDSYEKFVHHTTVGASIPVFDRFAARVLGPPPPRNEKAAAQTTVLSEALALVTKSA